MKRRLASFSVTLIVLALAVLAFANQQYLQDLYISHTKTLTPAASAIEGEIDLTKQGQFLYAASQPQFQASSTFNSSCGSVAREQSIVLGCYTHHDIFVYDVNDTRLNGVKEVTAAHELLHAAYERMSNHDKEQVDTELQKVAATITDTRLKETIAEYRQTEPSEVTNELHSIFGTEVATLTPALEAHYAKYFTNRQKIVGYSKQYEGTFTALDNQIKAYDKSLMDLKTQKETLEKSLKGQQSNIDSEQTRLEQLRDQTDAGAYNAAVPGFNALITTYNSDVSQLKSIISQYNDIVAKRNNLAATQNDLVKQLDSTYQKL